MASLQGWDKDKFSGLNSSDERHLRLLTDAGLEQRFLLQLVFALAACFALQFKTVASASVSCLSGLFFKSYNSYNRFLVASLQGWDKDKFQRAEFQWRETSPLTYWCRFGTAFSLAACLSLRFECLANAFMSCLSSCSWVDCFCVKSLQGWDKDKFSGLNSSDERHLRLLMQFWNSVFFCSLLVTAVWKSFKCFHVMFVLLFIGWLFLCEEFARMRQR